MTDRLIDYVFVCEESEYQSLPRKTAAATRRAAGLGCCDSPHRIFARIWNDGAWRLEEVTE